MIKDPAWNQSLRNSIEIKLVLVHRIQVLLKKRSPEMMKKKSDLAIYLKSQCLEVEFEI